MQVAVIGSGKISEEHLRFLVTRPDVRIAGICDLSEAIARFNAERHGVAAAFTDHARMLAEVRPDVVHVLTPPHSHLALVLDALEAGAHVIVEKPIARSLKEFETMWSAASQRRRHLVENHNYRFNEPVRRLEQLVAQGALGRVHEVEVRMALGIRDGRYGDQNLRHPSHELPAGVIHEFLTHLCYLALHFVPHGPDEHDPAFDCVKACWSNHGGGVFKYDDLDAIALSGPVHVRIRFSCYTKPDCFSVTVRGSEGSASCDLFQPQLQLDIRRGGPQQIAPMVNQVAGGMNLIQAGVRNFYDKVMQKTPYQGLYEFLRQTYDAFAAGAEPPVARADMARTLRLIDALLRAAE
jgi:predicted dehydrogenase